MTETTLRPLTLTNCHSRQTLATANAEAKIDVTDYMYPSSNGFSAQFPIMMAKVHSNKAGHAEQRVQAGAEVDDQFSSETGIVSIVHSHRLHPLHVFLYQTGQVFSTLSACNQDESIHDNPTPRAPQTFTIDGKLVAGMDNLRGAGMIYLSMRPVNMATSRVHITKIS